MEYLISFIEGMITFISPCILPMIPIYMTYFIGQDETKKTKRVVNSIFFVLGFTIVFVLLGVLASSFGMIVRKYQNIFNIVFGIIMIIFGLNMIGTIKINLLNKEKRFNLHKKEFGKISSFLFGILFSIGWTPCIGTFLGSALMIASTSGEILRGTLLLLLFSLGLGVPFILSSILIEKLKKAFTWIKEHYDIINKVSGIFLIILGILMATGVFNYIFRIII